ncbi:hypothetical protein SAMD00019534_095430 [Acytostelium subglobosum LB1]|uniref:hypothetical protein n=1 Tax=Acytostelium subglobosum LB1 TaxID=1410327 RepID=UPI000644ABA0|nr:hypothetical protein SAMD00019534_095430 [Acytostelium subglobosum LB1]GAM26368.1 hypothetical protein SAMD00019534_095430 [Acytostelium subglobosum LB1]|eukprot:XP_012750464.1 hypothetical protein SAMD00019534_095430 [Acytostelium subglobosum LB1]
MAPEGRHYANKLVLERNANGTIYGVAELCQVQLKRGNVITMVSYQTGQYKNLLNGTNSRNVTYKARMNVRNPSVFDKYRATHGMTTSSSDNSHHPCPSDNEEEYDEEAYNDDMYEHGQAAHNEGQSDDSDGGDEMDDEPHYESYGGGGGGGGGMDNSDGEQTQTGTIEHAHVPMMEDVPQLQDTLMNTHYYNDGDKVYAMSIEVDVGTWWPGTVKSSDYDEHNEVMSYVVKFDQGTDSQLTVQENVCISTAYTQQDDSNTKLKMTVPFRACADGASEAKNKNLADKLRKLPEDSSIDIEWPQLIPVLEFAMNSAVSKATKLTPFQVVYGKQPLAPIMMLNPKLENSAQPWDLVVDIARENTLESQIDQAGQYNKGSQPMYIRKGDKVLIKRKYFDTKEKLWEGEDKLSAKNVGPFLQIICIL